MAGLRRRTIKTLLDKKVQDWLDSITQDNVRNTAARNVIVTGGCIASYLQGETPNDFDLYFKDIDTAELVANYYVGVLATQGRGRTAVYRKEIENIKGELETRLVMKVDGSGLENLEPTSDLNDIEKEVSDLFVELTKTKPKYRPTYLTSNAITLSDRVQLIIRFSGAPGEIHKNFDFVHATCYYDYHIKSLVIPEVAIESLLTKDLRYVGSLYPLASILRLRKFIRRGWRIGANDVLKILWQVRTVDMENVEVLREQLTGVDVAYFDELIAKIRDSGKTKIDEAYLATLLDEIFD
jgi:hypothetical protein